MAEEEKQNIHTYLVTKTL